jgi:hypothetical protein
MTGAQGAIVAAVELDRDAARQEALRELTDPRYAADDPSLVERILNRAFEWIGDLLDGASSVVPGGLWGLLILVVVVAVVGIALAIAGRRILRERGARAPGALLGADDLRSAADLRRIADDAAADGRWADAVMARMRAIVRAQEERGLLGPGPGRTADEAAAAIGAVVPDEAGALRAGARAFDEVAFGKRPGTSEQHALLLGLDERLQRARVAA